MPIEYGNGKKYYTTKERFEYNAKKTKVGAVNRNGEPLSDFTRGVYAGKNAEIKRQSRKFKARKSL